MNKRKNLVALKKYDTYKDNPSDNIIAILDFNKTNIFDKIITSRKRKITHGSLKLGKYNYNDEDFILVNLPTLSKNKITSDFIKFFNPILIVIVIADYYIFDNIDSILKIFEINNNIIISTENVSNINTAIIESELKIPIIENKANKLMKKIYDCSIETKIIENRIVFENEIEDSIKIIENFIKNIFNNVKTRILSIELLTNDDILISITEYLNYDILKDKNLLNLINEERKKHKDINKKINNTFINKSREIYNKYVNENN